MNNKGKLIVQNKPLLTEEEMKKFSTYEEIVEEAITMFENKVEELLRKNDSNISYCN